ncbi:hypothetical protein C8J30_1063 [Rhodobacter viridis]|uniref:Uncharacterized protein n=1 Tax=Rhodobacter viridis TaxID=1054202 RepID=A0A318TY37_9RHOB|nr:hypothetical protein [Rhodobacter viridis]PYF09871.1 hypothetical protein C8J30_1063 [Rhodobacter viridis]
MGGFGKGGQNGDDALERLGKAPGTPGKDLEPGQQREQAQIAAAFEPRGDRRGLAVDVDRAGLEDVRQQVAFGQGGFGGEVIAEEIRIGGLFKIGAAGGLAGNGFGQQVDGHDDPRTLQSSPPCGGSKRPGRRPFPLRGQVCGCGDKPIACVVMLSM